LNPNGTPDTTFGGQRGFPGVATAAFGAGLNASASSLAIQKDRKIVVAGYAYTNDEYSFALARFNPDGTLDPSFGDGGTVRTDFGADDSQAEAIVIQKSGRIVACGTLARVSDGTEAFALAGY